MPAYSDLTLVSPDDNEAPAPDLPHEIPPRVERAGLYINHAAAVGDELGVDIQPLVDTYNSIYNRDEEDTRLTPFDVGILIDALAEIEGRLSQAIDDYGRPLETDDGRILAASPQVHTDVEGRLVLTSRHLLVVELREKLLEMLTMLRFARAQHAPIVLV